MGEEPTQPKPEGNAGKGKSDYCLCTPIYRAFNIVCVPCERRKNSECEYCGLVENKCECWNCEYCMCKQDHEAHDDGCPAEGTDDDIYKGC